MIDVASKERAAAKLSSGSEGDKTVVEEKVKRKGVKANRKALEVIAKICGAKLVVLDLVNIER